MYFGFTNCPDVCPTTMTDLRTALDGMGDDADRVDVAMVTVDPARDTDVLTGYVQSYVDDAHAVATDDDADLRRVAESFGVAYEVMTAPDGTIEVGPHRLPLRGRRRRPARHLVAVRHAGRRSRG